MKDNVNAASFLQQLIDWAVTQADVVAVALVGSHGRGDARPDSDVDIIILCFSPPRLLGSRWPWSFGDIASCKMEDYGALKSLRVFYRNGLEVEFGIAERSWIHTPLDEGTRRVLNDGVRVLHDPEALFEKAGVVREAANFLH